MVPVLCEDRASDNMMKAKRKVYASSYYSFDHVLESLLAAASLNIEVTLSEFLSFSKSCKALVGLFISSFASLSMSPERTPTWLYKLPGRTPTILKPRGLPR